MFSIAIDGPSGAGKSSVAKQVADALGLLCLDSGAMYRAVGLYMRRAGVDLADAAAVGARAGEADVGVFFVSGTQHVTLSGEDVSEEVRRPEIADSASKVSKVPEVRRMLVELQRALAREKGVVMEGRDIGTEVLPDASLKVYLTADARVRAERRYAQQREKGETESLEDVYRAILARDDADTHRALSPLRKADDAVEIDCSHRTQDEVVAEVLRLAAEVRK